MLYDMKTLPAGARAALLHAISEHFGRLSIALPIGPASSVFELPHTAVYDAAVNASMQGFMSGADPIPFSTGLKPSDDDVRDYPFVWSGKPPTSEMDYRSQCSPIKDQGQAGACTAFETVAHVERLVRLGWAPWAGGYSERANYNMSRQLLGFTGDSGATLRAAVHAAYKYGLPFSSQFPYSDLPGTINDLTIPDEVMATAAANKIDAYYRIDADLADKIAGALNRRIDCALADGFTVGIGIWLMRWFYYVAGPLSTHAAVRHNPMPQQLGSGQTWDDIIGAHAMTIVGRSEALQGYIVRNSWGTGWGDQGYYLLPFADTLQAFEFWVVSGFDGSNTKPAPYDSSSAEAQAARLYTAAFGRYADVQGLAFQTQEVQAHGLVQVARNFMASPEFKARYGETQTNEAFVTLLYRNALHRSPDTEGFNFQLNALASGQERAQLLVGFSESPENRTMP